MHRTNTIRLANIGRVSIFGHTDTALLDMARIEELQAKLTAAYAPLKNVGMLCYVIGGCLRRLFDGSPFNCDVDFWCTPVNAEHLSMCLMELGFSEAVAKDTPRMYEKVAQQPEQRLLMYTTDDIQLMVSTPTNSPQTIQDVLRTFDYRNSQLALDGLSCGTLSTAQILVAAGTLADIAAKRLYPVSVSSHAQALHRLQKLCNAGYRFTDFEDTKYMYEKLTGKKSTPYIEGDYDAEL